MRTIQVTLVGATVEKNKTSLRNEVTSSNPRVTTLRNSNSNRNDPAKPINEPSYPRDNSAILF